MSLIALCIATVFGFCVGAGISAAFGDSLILGGAIGMFVSWLICWLCFSDAEYYDPFDCDDI